MDSQYYEELLEFLEEIDSIDKGNENTLIKELETIYDDMYDDLIDVILAFYGKYGEDLTWNDAHKTVNGTELKEVAKRKERLKKLKDSTDIKEVKSKVQIELQLLKNRGLITRDKLLVDRINERMTITTVLVATKIYQLIKETYIRESGGKNIDITVPHFGKNWVERLFDNKNKLLNSIKVEILKGIEQGRDIRKTIKIVQKLGNMSKYEASRLVRTENCIARTEGALENYRTNELITHVVIIAVGDDRTCPDCRSYDGTYIPIEEARVGNNIPPFHPSCRCCIAPVSDK